MKGTAGHPGPPSVELPVGIIQAIVEHARAGYPNEACGVIVGDRDAAHGGRPLRFVATANAAASPYRYEIDSGDLLRISLETDDAGEAIWGIVHSHTHTPPRPSPTDVGLAFYPEAVYVLVSLADMASPETRAWRIVDGTVHEVAVGVGG